MGEVKHGIEVLELTEAAVKLAYMNSQDLRRNGDLRGSSGALGAFFKGIEVYVKLTGDLPTSGGGTTLHVAGSVTMNNFTALAAIRQALTDVPGAWERVDQVLDGQLALEQPETEE